MTRVLALILDAIDPNNIYAYDFDALQSRYEANGRVFTCSTRPHTAESNPMIWGGVENNSRYWVTPEDENVEGIYGRTVGDEGHVDPAQFFDREEGSPVEGAKGFSREADYADESFIWDDLYAAGYDARALQVPVVLPPYSYRVADGDQLAESWFPDTQERMAEHVREKPARIRQQFDDGADFVASSIQMPDKWLHGIGEGEVTESWTMAESGVLDAEVDDLLSYCESEGIEWVVFGDHGSPTPGAMKVEGADGYTYTLPRHEKESIVFSSDGLTPPTYSHEMYRWFRELFDVEPAAGYVEPESGRSETTDGSVKERLQNLGYME